MAFIGLIWKKNRNVLSSSCARAPLANVLRKNRHRLRRCWPRWRHWSEEGTLPQSSSLTCPLRIQCQSFVVLIPPFCGIATICHWWAENKSTPKSLNDPQAVILYASHFPTHNGSVLAHGSLISRLLQFTKSKSLLATPVTQVAEIRKVWSTATRPYNSGLLNTVGFECYWKFKWYNFKHGGALARSKHSHLFTSGIRIYAIVSSIRQLTPQMHRDKEKENDDDCRPTKRIKLDDAWSKKRGRWLGRRNRRRINTMWFIFRQKEDCR